MSQNGAKKAILLLVGAVIMILLAGCGLSNRSDVSTLIADENGRLTCALVEPLEDGFTQAELEDFIRAQIGDLDITLGECSLRDDGLRIELTYESAEDYAAFNGTACFCGTVAEAKEAGYDFAPALIDENGEPADLETIEERAKEWKVLIFEEPMNVRVPDKVLYTTENLKVTGRLTADWKEKPAATDSEEPANRLAIDDFEIAYVIYK